ncbi:hypothetical protein ACROYT_G000710 [Oculina patagonica]
MADRARILFLVLAICPAIRAQESLFGIVEPFPENIYPLEFTSAEVTCVAFDKSGTKTPEKILFERRDEFNNYKPLNSTINPNLHFESRTDIEDGKTKLSATMKIKNVTLEDDSLYGALGSYECHAYAVGDVNERSRHGFSVSVITRDEIPQVVVPDISVLQHDDDVTLICNLTERGNKASTPLKRISWFKDGELLESVRNPDPQEAKDTLGPLKIEKVKVTDGGHYTCLLEVLLRNVKQYNVSDDTVIHIEPWLPAPKEDIEEKSFKGKDVSFRCAARGFPLEVEWKVKKKSEDSVQSCINGSNGNYKIDRDNIYSPYILTISDVQYTDRGFYYCCLPSNCSDSVEGCQKFILRVRDPLGALWPVIGILIEAIVLFLIIFLSEKFKKKKQKADKEDGRMEFSYSSTDDGDRGQVRLRKVGETAVA